MAHPTVPIAAAETAGLDVDDDTVFFWCWIGDGFDADGALELIVVDCFHGFFSLRLF